MSGARFIHTADWQLGMKGGRLGEAAEAVTGLRVRTVRRILETARERDIDTVLACGDLFEHDLVADDVVRETAAVLAEFPEVVVHAIPGNHDPAGPGSVWRRAALARLDNLRLHERTYDGTPVEIGEGVFLHAFPVASRYQNTDPLAALADLHEAPGIHVGMAHGHLTTETFGGHEEDVTLPLDPRHVERSGLDYLALGHWHSLRVLDVGGAPRIAYSGTHEPTRFAETDPGQVIVVGIDDEGAPPRLERVSVAQLAWARLEFALEDAGDVLDMRAALIVEDADVLELRLTGSLDDAARERVDAAIEAARRGRAFVDVRDEIARRAGGETSVDDPTLLTALAAIDAADVPAAVRLRARRLVTDWTREEAS